ncbi:uncharacterized protein LOC131928886 [Physella acuta]|uniref:uncharacterized protein LOC131928886 n=1 Tax=Physella acuta TaxID=109671 RepID=UPI0027DE491F|nr:uncharacterized protein LOC131928886 [Physella acuta]
MSTHKKRHHVKRAADLESEKLRQEIEDMENALILHHRYQAESEKSVRGMIRKEIGGSRWEHGGEGKLTTYKSNRDLVTTDRSRKDVESADKRNQVSAVGDNQHIQSSKAETNHHRKARNRGKSSERQAEPKKTQRRSESPTKLEIQSVRPVLEYVEHQGSGDAKSKGRRSKQDDEVRKVKDTVDPGLRHGRSYNVQDTAGRNENALNNNQEFTKLRRNKDFSEVTEKVTSNRDQTKSKSGQARSKSGQEQLKSGDLSSKSGQTTRKKTGQTEESQTYAPTSPENTHSKRTNTNFSRLEASQLHSIPTKANAEKSKRAPIKINVEKLVSTPTKVNAEKQQNESYNKNQTPNFMSPLIPGYALSLERQNSDGALKKTKPHSDSKPRRHTTGVDNDPLSNKWAVTSQGVSYLESKTWRHQTVDGDDSFTKMHSTPSSRSNSRSSMRRPDSASCLSPDVIHSPPLSLSSNTSPVPTKRQDSYSDFNLFHHSTGSHFSPVVPAASWEHGNIYTQPSQGVLSPVQDVNKILTLFTDSGGVYKENSLSPQGRTFFQKDTSLQSPAPVKCDAEVEFWLHQLGLQSVESYIALFAEHQMDMASVRLLSANSLRAMGINALGPIMKIIKGVQILCREDNPPSTPSGENPKLDESEKLQDSVPLVNKDKQSPQTGSELLAEKRSLIANLASLHLTKSPDDQEGQLHLESLNEAENTQSFLPSDSDPSQKTKNKLANMKIKNNLSDGVDEITPVVELKGKAKKSNKVKGKNSSLKVTGKPPAATKLSDDGVASAAQRISIKQQQQRQKELADEKNMALRKQIRDNMAAKHVTRRSSSLERTSVPKKSGLERSSSFSSPKIESNNLSGMEDFLSTRSLKPKQNPACNHQEERYLDKSLDKLDIFASDDGDAGREGTYSKDAALGTVRELQKQLSQLELHLIQQQDDQSPDHPESCGDLVTEQDDHSPARQSEDDHSPAHSARRRNAAERRRKRAAMGWVGDEEGEGLVLTSPFYKSEPSLELEIHNAIGAATDQSDIRKLFAVDMDERKHKVTEDEKLKNNNVGSSALVRKKKQNTFDDSKFSKPTNRSRLDLLTVGYHIENLKKVELNRHDIDFNISDLLGDGTFSQVYKGKYQDSGVAVKQLKTSLVAADRNYFAAEVSMLQELEHPHVVRLLGVCITDRLPLIVLEFMSGGNLHTLLHDHTRPSLKHEEYCKIGQDISSGMLYLHQHNPPVLHLDLKSPNVLLGQDLLAKVADFGFSKLKHEADAKMSRAGKPKQPQHAPAWMAPELITIGEVTAKADVYSYGMVLWEMLTRQTPYNGCSVYQVLEQVRMKKRPEIPGHCPTELTRLIERCWDQNPAARPNFKEVSKSWCQIAESAQIVVAAAQEVEQQVSSKMLQKLAQVCSPTPVLEQEVPDSARMEVLSFSSEGSEVRESSSSDCDLLPGVTSPGTINVMAHNEKAEDYKPNIAKKSEPAANVNQQVDKLLQDNSQSLQDNSESLQDIMKRYLPLSRPHSTPSKSFDQKKPSHLNHEKLLPLRHSLDKPHPLPLSSVTTSQPLTTSVSPTLPAKLPITASVNFTRKPNSDQHNKTGTLQSESQSYVPSFYKDIQPKRKIIKGNLQADEMGHRRQRLVDNSGDGKNLIDKSLRGGDPAKILSDRSPEADNPSKTLSHRLSGVDNSSKIVLDTPSGTVTPTKGLSDSSPGIKNPLFSENNSCRVPDISESTMTEKSEISPPKDTYTTNVSNAEGAPLGINKPTELSFLPFKSPSSPSSLSDSMSRDPTETTHKDLSTTPHTTSSPADIDKNFKNSDPTFLQNKTSQLTDTVCSDTKPVRYRPLARDLYSELSTDISLDSLVCEKVGLKVETNNKTNERYNSSVKLTDDVTREALRTRHRTSSPKSEARKSDKFNHFRVVSSSQQKLDQSDFRSSQPKLDQPDVRSSQQQKLDQPDIRSSQPLKLDQPVRSSQLKLEQPVTRSSQQQKLDQPDVRSSQQQKLNQLVSMPEPKRSDKHNHFSVVSSTQPLKSNRSTSNTNYQSFFLHPPDDTMGNLREPEVGRFSLNTVDSLDGVLGNGGTAVNFVSSNDAVIRLEFARKFSELNVHLSQDDATPRDSLEFDNTQMLQMDNDTAQKQHTVSEAGQ